MCRHQPWEDDSPLADVYAQSIANGMDQVNPTLEARIAMLEARISNVEARVERLEARMYFLQKGMRIILVLFLITLAFAIFK